MDKAENKYAEYAKRLKNMMECKFLRERGFSIAEIAYKLELPESTVRSYVR